MRKGQRGKKVAPPPNRLALSPKDRLRQQAYTLRNARDFAGAKPLLAQLFELEPTNMPLALDYGEALMETEDFAGAVSLYAKLIEADPKNLAAVTNLGGALIRQGKLSDARSILEYALELDPKSIHARINLGSVLQASGERKANLDNALEAVQIDPSSSLAFNNLGSAFSDMAMFKEARHAYETAVMLDPDQIDALINLAAVEARLGDSKASAEMYERVIKKLPKEAEQRIEATKFYAAFEYLKQGNLEKGWDYYEGGFSPLVPATGARSPRRTFDVPRWDGKPLNGKTLLVWREQGLGDELLFYTCLHELKEMGGKVIVECDKRLVDVMARSFPEFTVRAELFMPQRESRSPVEDFDCHLPAGSLMRYFRPTIESFNRSGAYIKPDPAKVAKFAERLAPYKDDYRLVGICWRSGKLDPVRNLSYTMLDEWGEVLQTPGFKFVNLQYGECEAELKEAEGKYGIEILRWSDLNLRNDLDDVFALMSCLDNVVSVQTAVLVMAGAIGINAVGLKSWGWTSLGSKFVSPWFSKTLLRIKPEGIINGVLEGLFLNYVMTSPNNESSFVNCRSLSAFLSDLPFSRRNQIFEKVQTKLICNNLDGFERFALLKTISENFVECITEIRPVLQKLLSDMTISEGLRANSLWKDTLLLVSGLATRINDTDTSNSALAQVHKSLDKTYSKEHARLAWINFRCGNLDGARMHAENALNNFDFSEAREHNLFRLIAELGDYPLSLELLTEVQSQDTLQLKGIYSSIAQAAITDCKWELAIELLERESRVSRLSHGDVLLKRVAQLHLSEKSVAFKDLLNSYVGESFSSPFISEVALSTFHLWESDELAQFIDADAGHFSTHQNALRLRLWVSELNFDFSNTNHELERVKVIAPSSLKVILRELVWLNLFEGNVDRAGELYSELGPPPNLEYASYAKTIHYVIQNDFDKAEANILACYKLETGALVCNALVWLGVASKRWNLSRSNYFISSDFERRRKRNLGLATRYL